MNKILSLIVVLMLTVNLHAQKIIKKIANEVCDCVEENIDPENPKLDEVMNWCMQQQLIKNEKALNKEYGEENIQGKGAEAIGIAIGKEMLKDCPFIFELAIDQTGTKKDDADNFFAQAQGMVDSGEYVMAIDLYSKAIERNPVSFDYFNYRGIAYFSLGEYYRAISDFYRATDLDPDNHLGLYNAAYTIYTLGDNESALEVVDKLISVNNYYCEGYNLKGLIYNQTDQNDSAAVYYSKAIECDSSKMIYIYNLGYSLYHMREYEKALTCFEQAEAGGYDSYDLILYKGNCYDQLDENEKALECHTKLIDNYEVNYVPYYNRGMVFMAMGQYDDALQDFVAANALESSDLDVDEQMARAYKAMGKYDQALDKCNMIIEQQTANASFRDLRAEVYTQMGELNHAIEDYEMSLSLYPNDCKIHERLGELYKKVGDNVNSDMHNQIAKEMGCDRKE